MEPRSGVTLGISEKDIGVRRGGAEEADSRIAAIIRIRFVLRAPQLGAPLRYGPRAYLSAYALSLTLRRSGLPFLFFCPQGCAALRLTLGSIGLSPRKRGCGMVNV